MVRLLPLIARYTTAALAIAASHAIALRAQAVRGTVVMPDGASPAAGVIIALDHADGTFAARALTDERGTFLIRLTTAGDYRGRALRVGFQPTAISSISVLSTGTATVRIVLNAAVVTLPSVSVRSQDICRGQSADGEVVAAIWEEARKALLASGMSADASPLFAEWVEYERMLDATARFVRGQRIKTTRAATTHAFRSVPWQRLSDSGYVVDTDDGTVFHAPDADVLLSDSFASLHCFHVEPPGAEHRGEIGVGFRPARERSGVSEIEGTFWIDRATSELRSLDYHYTNLPAAAERAKPGGLVEFLRLASGSWLVSRWNIRMPQLSATAPTTSRGRSVRVSSSTLDLSAVRIVGGEVSTVHRGDSTLFRSQGATLAVVLSAPDTVVSRADARVSLQGTDYSVVTSADGRVRLTPILPGQYRLFAQTPLMDSLGIMADPVDVTVRVNETRAVTVALPSAQSLWKRVCGESAASGDGAHLRGVIVDSAGLPVENTPLRLTWQQQVSIVRDRLMWTDQSVTTTSDSLGNWQVCGVPRDVGLMLRVESAAGSGRTAVRVAEGALFAAARVVVRPLTVAEAARLSSVTITVTDSAGKPVRDALLSVGDGGKSPLRFRTDSAGRAVMTSIQPGSINVEIRKVGFASGTLSADVDRGENSLPIVMQRAGPPRLAEMRVFGDRVVPARQAAFDERQRRGDANAVVTREEIEKRSPSYTWQLLTRLPTITVLDSLGFIYAKSSRTSSVLCWPRVAIDGKIIAESDPEMRPNLAFLPPPSEIYGIEVFAGSARLPLDLGGEGQKRTCGLISITTR